MDQLDEYRNYAALCVRMAKESSTQDDKRQWLRLAQAWVGLIRVRERPPDEAVVAETLSTGTA
jgi:hypothetical protein